jgi:hypothetical protein
VLKHPRNVFLNSLIFRLNQSTGGRLIQSTGGRLIQSTMFDQNMSYATGQGLVSNNSVTQASTSSRWQQEAMVSTAMTPPTTA